MRTIQVKCDICGVVMKPATNVAQSHRTLNCHKSKVHGIRGVTSLKNHYVPVAERRKTEMAQLLKKGAESITPNYEEEERTAKRRAYQKEWRERRKKAMANHETPQPKPQPMAQAEPCKLSECPNCHATFFLVRHE